MNVGFINEGAELSVKTPTPNCRMRINPGGVYANGKRNDVITFEYEGKLPNVFHRWAQRVFFGFVWERIEK